MDPMEEARHTGRIEFAPQPDRGDRIPKCGYRERVSQITFRVPLPCDPPGDKERPTEDASDR